MLRGGVAIAAGSDGCVFDGTFAADGTFTPDPKRVTKVYEPAMSKVAASEWAAMQLVKDATGGVGVVVAEGEPMTIAKIPDDAWGGGISRSACEKLKAAKDGDTIVGLVMPRINGTLLGLQGTLTEASFTDLRAAVNDLALENIIHLDFAARNIFYTKEGRDIKLLLGDFGNTFKFVGSDLDTNVQAYVTRYNFRGQILASTKIDGVHPIAVLFIVLYDAFLAGKETYDAVLAQIRDQNLFAKVGSLATESWVVRRLVSLELDVRNPDFSAAVEAFTAALERQFALVLPIFACPDRSYETATTSIAGIKSVLQRYLKRSDKCLLDLMALAYLPEKQTAAGLVALTATWFPSPAKGGTRRGGAAFKDAESVEDALSIPDPVLKESGSPGVETSLSVDQALAQVAGKRTQKTRRRRVKMSRRR
jgi:hypothetical protein